MGGGGEVAEAELLFLLASESLVHCYQPVLGRTTEENR